MIFDKQGRYDEALAAVQKSVQTYRRLALTQPDAHEVEFAESLRRKVVSELADA